MSTNATSSDWNLTVMGFSIPTPPPCPGAENDFPAAPSPNPPGQITSASIIILPRSTLDLTQKHPPSTPTMWLGDMKESHGVKYEGSDNPPHWNVEWSVQVVGGSNPTTTVENGHIHFGVTVYSKVDVQVSVTASSSGNSLDGGLSVELSGEVIGSIQPQSSLSDCGFVLPGEKINPGNNIVRLSCTAGAGTPMDGGKASGSFHVTAISSWTDQNAPTDAYYYWALLKEGNLPVSGDSQNYSLQTQSGVTNSTAQQIAFGQSIGVDTGTLSDLLSLAGAKLNLGFSANQSTTTTIQLSQATTVTNSATVVGLPNSSVTFQIWMLVVGFSVQNGGPSLETQFPDIMFIEQYPSASQ